MFKDIYKWDLQFFFMRLCFSSPLGGCMPTGSQPTSCQRWQRMNVPPSSLRQGPRMTSCTPDDLYAVPITELSSDVSFPSSRGGGGGGVLNSQLGWGCRWGGGSKSDPVPNRSAHTKNTPCHNTLLKTFICIPCCNIAHLGYNPVLLLFYRKRNEL